MIEAIYAAELLGIDPMREPQHMWLAEEALSLELPLGWRNYRDRQGQDFYHNELLELRQWQHPKLSYLIALARTFQARDRIAHISSAEFELRQAAAMRGVSPGAAVAAVAKATAVASGL